MQKNYLGQTDAISRYYAAFPALKKDQQSSIQYRLPPPAWCRKITDDSSDITLQEDLSISKDWNLKNKKWSMSKDRRSSYHGPRKCNKKRSQSFSRSFECKENLPEWVTHEGVWDMETQDPVREFIRAIALDEGYGTCENTVTDELREIDVNIRMKASTVPDWDNSLDLDTEWVITDDLNPRATTPIEEEVYAKFEAKFDRSIEALWSKDQANTPDDEYQDLPIDFQDLLSSPSDQQFFDPAAEKCSLISLTESIWSNDAYDSFFGFARVRIESPGRSVDVLHDRFKPLNLTDNTCLSDVPSPKQEKEPFSLYNYDGIYDAVPAVASVMQSLTTLNHSKNYSSFREVIPRRHIEPKSLGDVPSLIEVRKDLSTGNSSEVEREDLLTASRTHFRPIRKEADSLETTTSSIRYVDGATFDIKGELDNVKFIRSDSGFMYLDNDVDPPKRYLEYRNSNSINYGRLNLTDAQRQANSDLVDQFKFLLRFPICQVEKGVQTDEEIKVGGNEVDITVRWEACDECRRLTGAKKMRQSGTALDSIWSEGGGGEWCGKCTTRAALDPIPLPPPPAEEWSREWEELLSDISAAHAQFSGDPGEQLNNVGPIEEIWWRADRKRRHSAALRCNRPFAPCSHPHAPFLHCCAFDRPLTR